MYNKDLLIQRYQNSLTIGRKSMVELIEFLNKKGVVTTIPIEKFPKSVIGGAIYNVKSLLNEPVDFIDCIKHPDLYTDNRFNFLIYRYLRCGQNLGFYRNYQPNDHGFDKEVYIIFETNSQFFECNCSKLYLELAVFQGIDKEDIENQTSEFFRQLFFLQTLEEEFGPQSK